VERTANLDLTTWRAETNSLAYNRQVSARVFIAMLVACACLSALLASWLPLQVSVVTVFLFAGPHNWFELRYFLMRLPVRFGKSRNFFLTAFAGITCLTMAYVALPVLYNFRAWPDDAWPTILASWNTLLLLWLALLVRLRGKQKTGRDWSWTIPVALALCSLNWLKPELFSLAIVYLHPLVALWFLDRHLRRTRPAWLGAYRRSLCLLPLLLAGMVWQLSRTAPLADDNGLFWRITQHAGAQLLPNVSSHVLVAVHVFLEMLHYGVWLVALPLIARPQRTIAGSQTNVGAHARVRLEQPLRSAANRERRSRKSLWSRVSVVGTVPLVQHPRGFPKLVATALGFGVFLVVILWFGFSVDYATTRDVYFTVAIAHVLAEAPFLLKMI
jgi:hypothetical protein